MNLMKHYWIYFAISALVIVPGLISLATNGLNSGIDFVGGSLLELRVNSDSILEKAKLDELLGESYSVNALQTSGSNQYIIKSGQTTNEQKDQAVSIISENFGQAEVLRYETIGPTLSRELLKKTLTAVLLVAVIITIYVWRQFDELKYGVAAVFAMFHDTLVLLGIFSILGVTRGVEVDVLFVTAVLTTLSFSVHDTIVVFDRIRELKRKHPGHAFHDIADTAVLETLGRSINNSVTIIIMLLALFLLGGDTIRAFSLALLVGAVTGTYSSTFTAVPLLLAWEDVKVKRAKKDGRDLLQKFSG